ncbi:hypothetical protein ACJIZ3_003401 [Penstemon smallii]|uniref:Uncharacterized protein n=1 Tax=Penstemon smallii TaxID=265156 RepID=A0ABD3UC36_9LAMI
MSLVANLTMYLRTKYNLSGIFLVNVVQIWAGSTNILSIVGAIVSDVYLGRFRTLLFGTILSLLGMVCMTLTAGINKLRPPPCHDQQSQCIQPHNMQLPFLFTALGLIALGAGGIRPCNIAFGADQFDTRTKNGRAQLESFFNWWYFSFTIALVISLSGVVYVQTNISWLIGLAIPTACFVVSITIFLIGRHSYIYKRPEGTVFVDIAKVVVAAFKKRKIDLKSGNREYSFYDPIEEVEFDIDKSLNKVKRFKCLDKAALITDDPSDELDSRGKPKNGWRLCSVNQVENLKCLIGILPVWISGLGCFVAMDQQSTFGVLQAIQMNRTIGKNFVIPPAWLGITSMISLSIWIFIYEQIYIPNAKRILKRESKLTMQQRITVGIITSILCMVVAGIVEEKRQESALKRGTFVSPLHVVALIPQFMLSGLTEAFAAVALMEFFTLQIPEKMRSVAGAIFFLTLSFGSYLSSLIVNVIHCVTKGKGENGWLGGHDLNSNRLSNYYYIIAGLEAVNLIYFTFFASNFVHCGKAIKVVGEEELELENNMGIKDEEQGLGQENNRS